MTMGVINCGFPPLKTKKKTPGKMNKMKTGEGRGGDRGRCK